MAYKLTITPKPTYLHIRITGLNTKANVMGYLEDIFRECTTRGCFRVLIEECLEGPRINTIDVFQIAAEGSRRVAGYFKAIAYVDVNAEGDLMQFAETVAFNRGLPVRVFSSVTAAENWLRELDTEPDAPVDTG